MSSDVQLLGRLRSPLIHPLRGGNIETPRGVSQRQSFYGISVWLSQPDTTTDCQRTASALENRCLAWNHFRKYLGTLLLCCGESTREEERLKPWKSVSSTGDQSPWFPRAEALD